MQTMSWALSSSGFLELGSRIVCGDANEMLLFSLLSLVRGT